MKDAYQVFMNRFNISNEELIGFGVKESIFIEDSIDEHWKELKSNVEKGKQKVFIRGYGRDAHGTEMYLKMYREIFGHSNFEKDPNNNNEPTKLIKKLSGYAKDVKTDRKYERIRNYQVSHIFGRTKNPYTFTAPWNIVYVPKIIDPFTGHESKGDLTNYFQFQFQGYCINKYKAFIDDFNNIMKGLKPEIEKYLEDITDNVQFRKDVLKQFDPINLGDNHSMNDSKDN